MTMCVTPYEASRKLYRRKEDKKTHKRTNKDSSEHDYF